MCWLHHFVVLTRGVLGARIAKYITALITYDIFAIICTWANLQYISIVCTLTVLQNTVVRKGIRDPLPGFCIGLKVGH